MVVVRPALPSDLDAVRRLWSLYADEFRSELGAQDLAGEARRLPAPYDVPGNGLWVAVADGKVQGCVALKRLPQDAGSRAGSTVELTRMVVAPGARGKGIGKGLVGTAVAEAQKAGYRRIVLDTVPGMEVARSLYLASGFRECQASYATSPLLAPVFYEMPLDPPGLSGVGPDPAE